MRAWFIEIFFPGTNLTYPRSPCKTLILIVLHVFDFNSTKRRFEPADTSNRGFLTSTALFWYRGRIGFDLWLSGDFVPKLMQRIDQNWPNWQWYFCRRFIDFFLMKNRRVSDDVEFNSPSKPTLQLCIKKIIDKKMAKIPLSIRSILINSWSILCDEIAGQP